MCQFSGGRSPHARGSGSALPAATRLLVPEPPPSPPHSRSSDRSRIATLSPTCWTPRQGARRNARTAALGGGQAKPGNSCEQGTSQRESRCVACPARRLKAAQPLRDTAAETGCRARRTAHLHLRSAQRRRQHAAACRELRKCPRSTSRRAPRCATYLVVNDRRSQSALDVFSPNVYKAVDCLGNGTGALIDPLSIYYVFHTKCLSHKNVRCCGGSAQLHAASSASARAARAGARRAARPILNDRRSPRFRTHTRWSKPGQPPVINIMSFRSVVRRAVRPVLLLPLLRRLFLHLPPTGSNINKM